MNAGGIDLGVDLRGHSVVYGGMGVLGRVLVAALVETGASIALIVRDIEKALLLFPASQVSSERFLAVVANVDDGESLRCGGANTFRSDVA